MVMGRFFPRQMWPYLRTRLVGAVFSPTHMRLSEDLLRQVKIVCCNFVFFFFTPQPAEYGAEEFFLDAVPTLGLVRD